MYDPTLIEREMERQRLTNEKLAVKAGLSSTTVSALRNGDENVRLKTLKKAASALKLQVVISFEPMPEAEVIRA